MIPVGEGQAFLRGPYFGAELPGCGLCVGSASEENVTLFSHVVAPTHTPDEIRVSEVGASPSVTSGGS